jgi:predicted choloylglycine hydrolase
MVSSSAVTVCLDGSPRRRGQIHGESLRTAIHDLLSVWDADVGKEVDMGLASYLQKFEAETDFVAAMERWAPALVEEVLGIAEGASIPLNVCRCLQCMDEHWTHLDRLQGMGAPSTCSTAAMGPRGERPTILGQNMDLPKFLDGFQTLLRIRDEDAGLDLLVPSYAGFLGLFGLNSAGLGLVVNAISQLRQATRGVPVSFMVRSVLRCRSVKEAAAFLNDAPHASGQNYLLGDSSGFVSLECSEGSVVSLSETTCLGHTNHPLENTDVSEAYAGWDEDREKADRVHARTISRLAVLRGHLGRDEVDVAGMKKMLREVEHAVDCDFPVFTFCAAVMELGEPVMHLALGQPKRAPYVAYGLG